MPILERSEICGMRCGSVWMTIFLLCLMCGSPAVLAETCYLSEMPELILSHNQAWGQLGVDTAAHAHGIAGEPIRIGDHQYARGLGHHANGDLVILLDGAFSTFETEIGLQPCGSKDGSVIFRVIVDNEKRFDSGILRVSDSPVPVHVDIVGAQELRLEAMDTGDGITCDMANWAEARLTRSALSSGMSQPNVDIACFGRVVSWDPNRKDGCRSSRLQEFSKDDLFLETDLVRNADGSFSVPVNSGCGCIGLQWLNRRAIRELRLCLPKTVSQLPVGDIRVEGWFGESAWQGQWMRLEGGLSVEANDIIFRPLLKSPDGTFLQTQKVRWILPAVPGFEQVQTLLAFTRARWDTAKILVQGNDSARQLQTGLSISNGEFLDPVPSQVSLTSPVSLSVRYARSSSSKADQTILQFSLPAGAFGVAVTDILDNECLYLPDFGLFITRDPSRVNPAEYRKTIEEKKTILQAVKEMPDQTLVQAMARTHNPAQNEGPVMLSLACDNTKYVVERDGTLRFQTTRNAAEDWFGSAAKIRPRFQVEQSVHRSRRLEEGWLPIPVMTTEENDLVCTQRVFVAPIDDAGDHPVRIGRRGICVAHFTLSNTRTKPVAVSFSLDIQTNERKNQLAKLAPVESGFQLGGDNGIYGLIAMASIGGLKAGISEGCFQLTGELASNTNAEFVVFLPSPGEPLPVQFDLAALRRNTESYWKSVLASASQIETPDSFLNDLIRSSQVRCLIAARNEAEGSRVAPWIAAMSYGPLESEAHSVIRGMDYLGHADFARRGLEFFIHRYNPEGFLTTGYTTFGTAWHLWTLGEHVQLTGDYDWVRTHASDLIRVGEWIVRQTAKTRKLNPQGQPMPEYGLMPPGVMADWNSFAYHFCMNAYYFAALRELGTILGETGFPQGKVFQTQANELRDNLFRSYRWTQARSPAIPLRNGTWIARYPSQVHSPGNLGDFFPGQDAGRSWCYDVELGAHQLVPTGVLAPNDPEVTRMLDHMEDVQFLSDGWFDYPAERNQKDWFNLGGFSKVQPYYTRNAEIYALRDDIKPFIRSYFNSIASLVNPEVMTFWEHFAHNGAWDKTHETGYFLHQTRSMLVLERGKNLWLTPLIPAEWLQSGKTLSVNNVPTRFGPISFRINSRLETGAIEMIIVPPKRVVPEAIVVRLRNPEGRLLDRVEVNGQPYRQFDPRQETITLPASQESLSVTAHYR